VADETIYKRAELARELVLAALAEVRGGSRPEPGVLEEAAELLYEPPEGDHFLTIAEEGWAVEHPEACSERGDPEKDCVVGTDLRRWLELEVEPPLEPGEYLVEYDAEKRKTRVVRRADVAPDTV